MSILDCLPACNDEMTGSCDVAFAYRSCPAVDGQSLSALSSFTFSLFFSSELFSMCLVTVTLDGMIYSVWAPKLAF